MKGASRYQLIIEDFRIAESYKVFLNFIHSIMNRSFSANGFQSAAFSAQQQNPEIT